MRTMAQFMSGDIDRITFTNFRMHPIHTYVVYELPWEQKDKTYYLNKLPRLRVTFTEFSLKIRDRTKYMRRVTTGGHATISCFAPK